MVLQGVARSIGNVAQMCLNQYNNHRKKILFGEIALLIVFVNTIGCQTIIFQGFLGCCGLGLHVVGLDVLEMIAVACKFYVLKNSISNQRYTDAQNVFSPNKPIKPKHFIDFEDSGELDKLESTEPIIPKQSSPKKKQTRSKRVVVSPIYKFHYGSGSQWVIKGVPSNQGST